ncbi:MAG TPA: hypothetical protein VMG82_29020 [Candidatus Sulfotelmatobacter sp.]|nr:hypothetical protein [Candidatus Sulfotelmatobacter sp.]
MISLRVLCLNIFRTTNTQSDIATSFASIPYSNTARGNISEFRTAARYPSLNLMVKDKSMVYFGVRYVLSSTSGTLLRVRTRIRAATPQK